MAARRLQSEDSPTNLDHELPSKETPSDIRPAVPTNVIVKLLGFTFAMIILPIGSYFVTVNTVFKGNSTFAGALAAIMANVVLVGYVIVAMKEDQSDQIDAAAKAAKAKGKKAE